MFVSCWSVKGGSGTTVVAAALAVLAARSGAVLAVDAAGDLPAALGLPEPAGPGVGDWLAASDDVGAESLELLEHEASPGLSVLPAGAPWSSGARLDAFLRVLGGERRFVVLDAGIARGPVAEVAASAERSLLVLRPCYLALRRAVASPLRPSGVVLVREPGRALSRIDVSSVLDVPVVAEVESDPAVARAVDAGLLAGRLPRSLEVALRAAA